MLRRQLLKGLLCLFAALSPAAAGTVYVSLTDSNFNGVAMFNSNLTLIDQIAVSGQMNAIADGPSGTFYGAIGNKVSQFSNAGDEIASATGSSTTTIPSMAFAGDELYVGVQDRNFDGVARFRPDMTLIDQIGIERSVTALARGLNDTFYVASGNQVFLFDHAGNELDFITASSSTEIRDISFSGSTLLVGLTDRSFHGVATLSASLTLLDQFAVAGQVSGIAAGDSGTFYMGSGNTLFHYSGTGDVLGSISGSTTTQILDVAYSLDSAQGVPEPATELLLGIGLVALGAVRFRKRA